MTETLRQPQTLNLTLEIGPAHPDEGCRVLDVLFAERLDLEGDQAGV